MRFLIVVVLVIVLLVIGGWLVINIKGNSATIELQTDKIKHDTSTAVEKTGQTLKRAGEAIENRVERP